MLALGKDYQAVESLTGTGFSGSRSYFMGILGH